MSKALCLQTLAITASNFINAITSNNTLDFRLIFHIFEISNYHNFEGMVGNSLNAGWVQIMEMFWRFYDWIAIFIGFEVWGFYCFRVNRSLFWHETWIVYTLCKKLLFSPQICVKIAETFEIFGYSKADRVTCNLNC